MRHGPPSSPESGRVALPRVSTSVAVAAMSAISLAPGLLPRSAVLQGVFSGLLVAAGLLAMWAFSAVARRLVPTGSRPDSTNVIGASPRSGCRLPAPQLRCSPAAGWQNSLRAAMGAPSAGLLHWAEAGLHCSTDRTWSLGHRDRNVEGAAVDGFRAERRRTGHGCSRGAVGSRSRRVERPRRFVRQVQRVHRHCSDTATFGLRDRQLRIAHLVRRRVGAEGRKFVAAGEDSVRVYAGLDSAPDTASRAALAVSELDRVGGFTRNSVVVAVPDRIGVDRHACRSTVSSNGSAATSQ